MMTMINTNFFNVENQPNIPAEKDETELQSGAFAALFAGVSTPPLPSDLPPPIEISQDDGESITNGDFATEKAPAQAEMVLPMLLPDATQDKDVPAIANEPIKLPFAENTNIAKKNPFSSEIDLNTMGARQTDETGGVRPIPPNQLFQADDTFDKTNIGPVKPIKDHSLSMPFVTLFNNPKIKPVATTEKMTFEIKTAQNFQQQAMEKHGMLNPTSTKLQPFPVEPSLVDIAVNQTTKPQVQTVNPANLTGLAERETEFEQKLPKLFREISGIFSVEEKKLLNETQTAEIAAAEPVKAEAFIEQIEPKLLELAALTQKNEEKQILRMRLRPAELGTVEVRLERNENGGLNAFFKTETDSARQALSGNLEQLRESLQNAGWQIDRMEISADAYTPGGGNNENHENQSREFESADNRSNTSFFNPTSDTTDEPSENSAERLVNLRA